MQKLRSHLLCGILFLLSTQASQASPIPSEWEAGFQNIYQVLEKNLQAPSHIFPFFHAHPAPKFPAVYLWDSAFISIVWKYHDADVAKDVLRAALYHQDSNGRVPLNYSFLGSSKLSQAPLLSFAAADIVDHTQDWNFARELYPNLKRYHDWLWRARRLENGLFFWAHPYESGMDNSPRFSNRDESIFAKTKAISAIDLSSYIVIDAQSMSKLALAILNQTSSEEERATLTADVKTFEAQSAEVTELVRRELWDESSGYFFDRDEEGKFIRVESIASFFPLLAGIPTEHQWQIMRSHLINEEEFNTPNPLPSVARNSKNFEKDCWRGPVWINTAYLTIQGIKRYGDRDLAQYFGKRIADMVYRVASRTGKFVEFYDPERDDFHELTRKRGLGPFGLTITGNLVEDMEHLFSKRLFLGDKPVDHFVGWTGLVNNLALELE